LRIADGSAGPTLVTWCRIRFSMPHFLFSCYIFGMKKFIVASLLLLAFASPAFAAHRHHHHHHHHHHAA